MAEDLDEGLDGDLDDDAVRRLFLAQAGPPVDVESGLQAVHERTAQRRTRRMLVPIVVGIASAAAVVAVVLVRVGSDGTELVPAGPGTDLPGASSVSPSSRPTSTAVATTTLAASGPARTAPAPSGPASTGPTPSTLPSTTIASGPTIPALTAIPPVVASSDAPAAPAPRTQTFSCPGGSVTVRWTPTALDLRSVSATAGWMIEDQQARSDRVEVRFGASGEQRSELRLRLRDGGPVLECRD
jgi:hypothetical protein